MIRRIACLFVVTIILVPVAAFAQSPNKEKAAVAAAEKWLGLVDKGEYTESWKEAAAYFRNSVSEQKWEQAAQGVRKPLGELISRKVKTAMYKTSLPGAPDGEYVVMQFESSFANKKSAVETVTTVLDKAGKWRVVGYFIR
jgi:hypothetical protein